MVETDDACGRRRFFLRDVGVGVDKDPYLLLRDRLLRLQSRAEPADHRNGKNTKQQTAVPAVVPDPCYYYDYCCRCAQHVDFVHQYHHHASRRAAA